MQLVNPIRDDNAVAVDVDRNLLKTSLVTEAVLRLLRQNPLHVFSLIYWLARGRNVLEAEVAARIDLDPAALAYDDRVLEAIRKGKSEGRRIVLTTVSPPKFAAAIARHLGISERIAAVEGGPVHVMASEPRPIGEAMHERAKAPAGGARGGAVQEKFRLHLYLRAMRVHQWMKNLLVFVPLLLAHLVLEPAAIAAAGIAFLAFGFCASSVYILNDLIDLAEDRRHPVKRNRPFASGALPLSHGIALAPVLLVTAFALASLLPPAFALVLATYYAMTLGYSFFFKRMLLWDVIVLAGLYTLRIIAGSEAIGSDHSFWLLTFSVFLFVSLAMVKRYVELKRTAAGTGHFGRSYVAADLETLSQFGIASGLISVLVCALYIDSNVSRALYQHPELIWLICPIILYLVCRVWLLARRDQVPDDPVLFFMQDRNSLASLAACGVLLVLATL